MPFLFTTLICFCVFTSCDYKKQKSSTKKPVEKQLRSANEFAYLDKINDPNYLVSLLDNSSDLEDAGIGIEGRRSQSYSIFERLSAIASDSDLVRLTTHKNSKIRVYSI